MSAERKLITLSWLIISVVAIPIFDFWFVAGWFLVVLAQDANRQCEHEWVAQEDTTQYPRCKHCNEACFWLFGWQQLGSGRWLEPDLVAQKLYTGEVPQNRARHGGK